MPSHSKKPSTRTIAIDSTAEAYLELLRNRGIKYFFGKGGLTSPHSLRRLPSWHRREAPPLNP
jgi:hypothetical protein